MSDFRRFYKHGSEHFVHLDELDRTASISRTSSARSWSSFITTRHSLAQYLMVWANRIEPTNLQYTDKARNTAQIAGQR